MHVELRSGDITTATTEGLVCTANPRLQLTGGIGGLLLARCGPSMQEELDRLSRAAYGTRPAPRGAILVSGGGGLGFGHIFHVVSIDVFYKTDEATLGQCMEDALQLAQRHGLKSLAVPAFATGYGRQPLATCARAMRQGMNRVKQYLSTIDLVEIWLKDDRRLQEFSAGWQPA